MVVWTWSPIKLGRSKSSAIEYERIRADDWCRSNRQGRRIKFFRNGGKYKNWVGFKSKKRVKFLVPGQEGGKNVEKDEWKNWSTSRRLKTVLNSILGEDGGTIGVIICIESNTEPFIKPLDILKNDVNIDSTFFESRVWIALSFLMSARRSTMSLSLGFHMI